MPGTPNKEGTESPELNKAAFPTKRELCRSLHHRLENAMNVAIRRTAVSHQTGGDHRSQSEWTDDYDWSIDAKSGGVQICETAAPRWSGDELDDDEKNAVIAAIESAAGDQ